jgi:predicted metalloprotease
MGDFDLGPAPVAAGDLAQEEVLRANIIMRGPESWGMSDHVTATEGTTAARPSAGRRNRRLATVAVLLAVLSGSACSAGGGGEDNSRSLTDIVRDALEEAKDRSQAGTGNTTPQDDPDAQIGTDVRTDFDYTEYQQSLSLTIDLLQRFWSTELPRIGGTYSDLRGFTYYRSDDGAGPTCGDEPAPANNAFYCPAGDFIAWDETGLMIPYYVRGGDFAASFVLAHEFGHAMQVRLPDQEQTGVLRELQADCFAGAWAAWTADQDLLAAGDLDEATLAVFSGRDVPGTAWTDPQAHGSGFERTRAFGDGFEGGADGCYPAPGEDWILSRS